MDTDSGMISSSLQVYWFAISQTSKPAHPEHPGLLAETAVDFKNISVQVLSQVSVFVSA